MPRHCPAGLPILLDEDVIAGFPFGRAPAPVPREAVPVAPVDALRAALLPALLRPPCVIAFSGGRDSSVLLAVATALAREEGVDPPVAHTLHYTGDPAADESRWQESVLAHLAGLGLRPERARTEVTEQLDIIGPLTAPLLRGHGAPLFPPALAPTVLLTRVARGGSLVTGNFGDEILASHRAAVLRAVWRRRARGMARSDWSAVRFAAAPRLLRRHLIGLQEGAHPWLRARQRRRVAVLHSRTLADTPLRWDRSVRAVPATRAVSIGSATRRAIAAESDCALVDPFGEPGFVECWARHGGLRGGPTRTGAIRLLAGPLLPEELITRRTKASFNRSRFGPASREFARSWDGCGVDDDAVDPARLRSEWLSDMPSAASALLLQQAWLARNEGGT